MGGSDARTDEGSSADLSGAELMPTHSHHHRMLDAVCAHMDTLITSGCDRYGSSPSRMWMASLDTRTGVYPEDDRRPKAIGKRVYRSIDAPKGCTLYWDQPTLVAAHALASLTGAPEYADAADAYVRDFLSRCVASNGVFLWGNHYYYDAFRDEVLTFLGTETPQPCDMLREEGRRHEIRPIPPAWALFWRVDPGAAEREIRTMARGHRVDPETGEFNRHADGETGCAFLEAGGILVESLAWLYSRTEDPDLIEMADRIAAYSYRHRGPETDLLENNPTWRRWDKVASTTEVGLWALALLRAAEHLNPEDARAAHWRTMAETAARAWLQYGWDAEAGAFYGRLRVSDGKPILGPKETPYQPGAYSDLWAPLFPTHDYPMTMAEASLDLYQRTGNPAFRRACERWIRVVADHTPAAGGRGGYAEDYGRCIHMCARAAEVLESNRARALAHTLADEAIDVLFDPRTPTPGGREGMFRGHPGEDRYDAVDGVGYLLLALLQLTTGREPDMMGMGW